MKRQARREGRLYRGTSNEGGDKHPPYVIDETVNPFYTDDVPEQTAKS